MRPLSFEPVGNRRFRRRDRRGLGVDPEFAKAIAWAESRYDQIRNSPKGARGPMQLMPSTAIGLGVQDPCDPKSNVDGGIRHLRALIEEFQNPSWRLQLITLEAGPSMTMGAFRRTAKRSVTSPRSSTTSWDRT